MDRCADFANTLGQSCDTLVQVTSRLTNELAVAPDLALANATLYLDMFGRILASWLWLCQAMVAEQALSGGNLATAERNYYSGKLQAANYYFNWELPQIQPQAELLMKLDTVPYDMRDEWF